MPIYMKFEGIPGSVKGTHAGWIELDSCQFGSTARVDRSGSRSEKPKITEILITKRQDPSSTALYREAISGTGKNVIIDFVNGDGIAYLTITLDEAMISSMSLSSGGGEHASESIGLNSSKIQIFTKPAAPSTDPGAAAGRAAWQMAAH